MANKKKSDETGERAPLKMVKKRYLSDVQCKAAAERISAEIREDREGRVKWGVQWAAYLPYGDGTVRKRGPKPLTLIFPGDLDQAQADFWDWAT